MKWRERTGESRWDRILCRYRIVVYDIVKSLVWGIRRMVALQLDGTPDLTLTTARSGRRIGVEETKHRLYP